MSINKALQIKMAWAISALLPILLYANTLGHGFVLDDVMVITENVHVQQGTDGWGALLGKDSFDGYLASKANNALERNNQLPGGRYRPLSMLVFALVVDAFGNQAIIFHLINVLLYALSSVLLLACLNRFRPMSESPAPLLSFAFIATMLWTAHPLHTEVVANAKSLDEILAFILAMLTLYLAHKATKSQTKTHYLLAFPVFFTALFAKEHVITFMAVAPLLLWLMGHVSIKRALLTSLPLLAAALLFMLLRQSVVGGSGAGTAAQAHLMNNPFLEADAAQYTGTVAYTHLLYLKLLILPQPLTTDYYPYHIELKTWSEPWPLISILLYTLIIIATAIGLWRRKTWAAGPALYLITLLPMSNVLFSVGAFMAERFLFLPSLGFAMIVAWLMANKLKTRYATLILPVVLLLYSYKTVSRNADWESNLSLHTVDAETSRGSAFSNSIAGAAYLEKAKKEKDPAKRDTYFQEAFKYLERGLAAVPTHLYAVVNLGNAHYEYNRNYREALRYYAIALELSSQHEYSYQTLKGIISQAQDIGLKIKAYRLMHRYRPRDYSINYALGELYGRYRQMPDSALLFMNQAVSAQPQNVAALSNLAFLYAQQGKLQEAYPIMKRAHQLAPGDQMVRGNLLRMARELGDEEMVRKLSQP